MEDVDCVVIGAGVIGLASARALALRGREVLLLECERHIGSQTSSRNSEVIHGGLYYPPGSLKATMCVQGRELLYRYCSDHHVDYRRCGKFIVAVNEAQVTELQRIEGVARANGVTDLAWLSGTEAQRIEPQLRCHTVLVSPSTGILDSHGYMMSLLADAESYGASLVASVAVSAIEPGPQGNLLYIGNEAGPSLRCRTVVNAAGLNATALAHATRGLQPQYIPPLHLAKGNYFTLTGAAPFQRLVYPVPEPGGLGVHMTLDLSGRARFGPDVEWIEKVDYDVSAGRANSFYAAIRNYWPGLADGRLQAAYAGIRPKITPAGAPAGDFRLSGSSEHGIRGLVNTFGIESPGLTASLALAERIADLAS